VGYRIGMGKVVIDMSMSVDKYTAARNDVPGQVAHITYRVVR
jgi:hypothetical protein